MNENGYGLPLSRLSCLAMVEEKRKAWFARTQANGLYEFDKMENRVKLLMRFPNLSVDKDLYYAIEKVGNILVLAPASASKIVLYDLIANRAEYLEIASVEDERKVKYTGGCKFFKCFRCKDSIYFFGYEYPAVLKIDVKSKQIVYLADWVKEVERRIKKMFVTMGYVIDYVAVGDFVWALCECTNAVLSLDLRTDKIKVVDLCSDLDISCGICFDGNFWVAGYNETANKLLKYDDLFLLEEEIVICSAQQEYDNYVLSLQNSFWDIYPIIDLGERLLLFSVYPCHVYEFDKASEQVYIHPVFEELIKDRDERLYSLKILVPRRKGNLICFVTGNDFMWNEYDFVHNTLTQYEVRDECDDEYLQEYSKVLAGRIITEGNFVWDLGYKLPLHRFLEHVKYVSLNEGPVQGKNNNMGTRIHKECWEALDI